MSVVHFKELIIIVIATGYNARFPPVLKNFKFFNIIGKRNLLSE